MKGNGEWMFFSFFFSISFPLEEQIRVKDEEIRKALLAKQQLVADILHVPKEEFQTIAEMAGEPSVDREAAELVLAAVNQGWLIYFLNI